MKHFRAEIDCIFEAENIDDAFAELAKHFSNLANGIDSETIFGTPSKLEIYPVHKINAKDHTGWGRLWPERNKPKCQHTQGHKKIDAKRN